MKIGIYFILIKILLINKTINSKLKSNNRNDLIYDLDQDYKSKSNSNCCDDPVIIINSSIYTEGYIKTPPLYEELNDIKNSKKTIDCVYKFYGKPNERIQLFYEDFDLYYPYDVYKFNKIDCRYSDSVCLKFYENKDPSRQEKQKEPKKSESITLENHNYDLCNCINISYTPRQIISANNFIQIRFKSVQRLFDTSAASLHSRKKFRGYIIRYQFIKDYGLDLTDGGLLDKNGACKIYFHSKNKRDGYFSSPNYPGLYPRDLECHYYFIGQKNEKVQITFHTFDVEGVDQCSSDTKSDYVELSNFQNRDRFFSRFCGINKPGSIISDSSFFHVTFYSNNVFDGKGFQASFYFISIYDNSKSESNSPSNSEKRSESSTALSSSVESADQNAAIRIRINFCLLLFLFILKI